MLFCFPMDNDNDNNAHLACIHIMSQDHVRRICLHYLLGNVGVVVSIATKLQEDPGFKPAC